MLSWSYSDLGQKYWSEGLCEWEIVELFTFCETIDLRRFGVGIPENCTYDLEMWTRWRFLYNAPIHQVSSSYV